MNADKQLSLAIHQDAVDRPKQVDIPYLVLYGSVARAEANPNSDIDVLGIGGYGRIYDALKDFKIEKRDIASYDSAKAVTRAARRDPIWVASLAREGMILVAQDQELEDIFAAHRIVPIERISLEANSARAIFEHGLTYASNNHDRVSWARSSPYSAAYLIWGTMRRLAMLWQLCQDNDHIASSEACLLELSQDPLCQSLVSLARPAEKYYHRCKGRNQENYDKPTNEQLSIWLAAVEGLEKELLERLA